MPPGWSARRDALFNAGRQQQPALDMYDVPPPRSNSIEQTATPEQDVEGPISTVPSTRAEGGESRASAVETSAEEAVQSTLDQRKHNLPPLRVVGQVGTMYIVTEGPEGMF